MDRHIKKKQETPYSHVILQKEHQHPFPQRDQTPIFITEQINDRVWQGGQDEITSQVLPEP